MMSDFRRGLLALVVLGIVVLSSRGAAAQHRPGQNRDEAVAVHFESHGEPPPAHVCLVYRAHAGEVLPQSALDMKAGEKTVQGLPTVCGEVEDCGRKINPLPPETPIAGDDADDAKLTAHYQCRQNLVSQDGRPERVAVLGIPEALVVESHFAGDSVHLMLRPKKGASSVQPRVVLLGGDYHSGKATISGASGERLATLSLVPRCVRRDVPRPDFSCSSASRMSTSLHYDGAVQQDDALCVPLKKGARTTENQVTLKACGTKTDEFEHEFVARWEEVVPPHELEFEATRLRFAWQRSCLYGGECPSVRAVGPSLRKCRCVSENCKCTKGCETQKLCQYECDVSGPLPAKLRFTPKSKGIVSTRGAWYAELRSPGEELSDYISLDERRVRLKWDWFDLEVAEGIDCRAKGLREAVAKELEQNPTGGHKEALRKVKAACRAEWPGDEIDSVELRRPEGSVHRIEVGASHMLVPELDCKDSLSYRYVGRRSYREEEAHYDPSCGLELEDPDEQHASILGLGASFGGGLLFIPGMPTRNVGPQGQASLIVAFRNARGHGTWPWLFTWEPEVRLGALLAEHSYCSHFGADAPCGEDDDWRSVPYWRLFLEPSLSLYFQHSFRFDVGAGLAYSTFAWWRDDNRVPRRALFTTHAFGAVEVIGNVAFGPEIRLFTGERIRQVSFDEAGVSGSGFYDGGRASLQGSLVIRIDDLL